MQPPLFGREATLQTAVQNPQLQQVLHHGSRILTARTRRVAGVFTALLGHVPIGTILTIAHMLPWSAFHGLAYASKPVAGQHASRCESTLTQADHICSTSIRHMLKPAFGTC